MADFSNEQLKRIIAKINSYGDRPCPYCNSKEGLIINAGSSNIMKIENLETVVTRGFMDTIPVVTASCKHCGYIMQFNLQKTLE